MGNSNSSTSATGSASSGGVSQTCRTLSGHSGPESVDSSVDSELDEFRYDLSEHCLQHCGGDDPCISGSTGTMSSSFELIELIRPHSVSASLEHDPVPSGTQCCSVKSNSTSSLASHAPKSHKLTGVRLPIPKPRSKSFHHVLRKTQNGEMLAATGTIRGSEKPALQQKPPPREREKTTKELNQFLCKKRTELKPVCDRLCQSEVNLSQMPYRREWQWSSSGAVVESDPQATSGTRGIQVGHGSCGSGSTTPATGAVASKIQRAKRRPAPQPPPRANGANGHVSTGPRYQKQNSVEHRKDKENIYANIKPINDGFKIKRSVSNFDADYLCRMKKKNKGLLEQEICSSPWQLKPSKSPLAESGKYLSFEFLNERITNRLEMERQGKFFETTKSDEPLPSRPPSAISKNFSCSETNLSFGLKETEKSKKSLLSKRKSFKKLWDHYFGDQEKSDFAPFGDPSYFDQNFILKRSTPNAGLSEHDRTYLTKIKGYYAPSPLCTGKTYTKKQGKVWHHSTEMLNSVSRQLEIVANLIKQSPENPDSGLEADTDLILVNSHKRAAKDAISQEQRFQCREALTSTRKTNRNQNRNPKVRCDVNHSGWIPSDDLSSSSEDDELEEVDSSDCSEHNFENVIYNLEVEDFDQTRQFGTVIKHHNISPHLHLDQSPCTRATSNEHLTIGHSCGVIEPCFSLSNQLKTLIHNSNRLRRQAFLY